MKKFLLFALILLTSGMVFAEQVIIKLDNGTAAGNMWRTGRDTYEESVKLTPDGPCKIFKIQIYYMGTQAVSDTIRVCGSPTINWEQGWRPTHYVWSYNTLIDPIVINYDGNPGWKDIDVSQSGLRSDGYDQIVIQHYLKSQGPWFACDNNGLSGSTSWINNPWQGNGEDYWNYAIAGDYMVRLVVEYDFPNGSTTLPPPPPTFVDVTALAGITTPTTDVAAVDWNNDGMDDLAMNSNFYQNNGDGTYKNVTSQMGISGGNTMWGDINNDGYKDCYVLRLGSQDYTNAFMNNKDAVYLYDKVSLKWIEQKANNIFKLPYPSPNQDMFGIAGEQDSIPNPYYTCTPMWLDYDGDGWLDLFIASRRMEGGSKEIYTPDELWKNDGTGKFSNTREEANIKGEAFEPLDPNLTPNQQFGWGYYDCYGAAACDYNKDNKPDIFVANYRLQPDNLYSNEGNGIFNDLGATTGVRGEPTAYYLYFGHGMGCEWGDFNNDANPDLFVGNLGHPHSAGMYSNPSLIYENQGPPNYHFTNVRKKMGLKFHEGNGGVVWLDLNNDGLLDLWHGKYDGGKGSFYLNQGPPDYKLKEITWNINCLVQSPWSAVRTDFDMDGDEDLVIKGRLYRNDMPRNGNFVEFRLEGDPKDNVNMDAYGTKVTVYAGNKLFYRDLMGSSSGTHCNQNSSVLHFGLGWVHSVDSVVVIYNNGKRNKATGLEINTIYRVPYMKPPMSMGTATPGQKSPQNYVTGLPQDSMELKCYYSGMGTSFHFVISNKPDCSSIIWEDNINLSSNLVYEIPSGKFKLDCGTYYWRVQASGFNGTSPWSSIWNFTVCEAMPSAPILIFPPKDTTDMPSLPTLKWSPSTYPVQYGIDTRYEIQIATDSQMANIVIDSTGLITTQVVLNKALNSDTKYYWRVRGINKGTTGVWSEIWNFKIMSLPAAPVLTDPANGAIDVVLKPRLQWQVTPKADYYHIQISKDDKFSDMVYENKNVASNKIPILTGLPQKTKLYWRVCGVNDGGEGPWSEAWNFTTIEVNPVQENFQGRFYIIGTTPNPFSNATSIQYFISEPSLTRFNIYNAYGEEIETLESGYLNPGIHNIEWVPDAIPSGIYYCKVSNKNYTETVRLIYIK